MLSSTKKQARFRDGMANNRLGSEGWDFGYIVIQP